MPGMAFSDHDCRADHQKTEINTIMEENKPSKTTGQWWTAPTESESGRLIMVTGRKDVDTFRNNPRYCIRIEVSWRYDGLPDGMPDEAVAKMMEKAHDALLGVFAKDPVAVMTGV